MVDTDQFVQGFKEFSLSLKGGGNAFTKLLDIPFEESITPEEATVLAAAIHEEILNTFTPVTILSMIDTICTVEDQEDV